MRVFSWPFDGILEVNNILVTDLNRVSRKSNLQIMQKEFYSFRKKQLQILP